MQIELVAMPELKKKKKKKKNEETKLVYIRAIGDRQVSKKK